MYVCYVDQSLYVFFETFDKHSFFGVCAFKLLWSFSPDLHILISLGYCGISKREVPVFLDLDYN